MAGVDRSAEGVGDADQPGEIDSSLQHSGEVAIGFVRRVIAGTDAAIEHFALHAVKLGVGQDSVQAFADHAVGRLGNQYGDAAVPVLKQMIRGEASGKRVVDTHRQQPGVAPVAVHDDQRNARGVFLEFPQCGGVPRIRAGEHGDSGHVLLLERQAGRNAFAVIVRVDENPGRQVFLPHGCEMPFHQSQVRRVPARDREEEG